ncbi:MAG: archaetidylserine decarboxylase [Gammaproteobacteria bacterium]
MSEEKLSFKDLIKISPQYLYPHHIVSDFLGFLSRIENEAWKNLLIKRFCKRFKVDTKEAISRNLKRYPHFNAFYTRELKPEVRPVTDLERGVACPVDAVVSQVGNITDGEIVQAKGRKFTVRDVLGQSQYAGPFIYNAGAFITLILPPGGYRRIHMPFDGTLQETVHIPGRLFNTESATLNAISDVYAKNERVVNFFDTKIGPMALVSVGSIFSSSIETIWDGVITPPTRSEVRQWSHQFNPPYAKKGEEIGRFNWGSTVILLFAGNVVEWESKLVPETQVKMGELIGKVKLS